MLVFSGGRYRNLGLFNIIIVLFILIGIMSKAATGGYLVSMSIAFIYMSYKIRRRIFMFILSCITAAAMAIYSIYHATDSTQLTGYYLLHGRTWIWREALEILKGGSWIFGVGTGASRAGFISSGYGEVHNALLQGLAEGGVPELLILILIIAWIYRTGLSNLNNFGIVLVIFISGIVVRNIAECNGLLFGYLDNIWVFISWFVLVLILKLVRDTINESENCSISSPLCHND